MEVTSSKSTDIMIALSFILMTLSVSSLAVGLQAKENPEEVIKFSIQNSVSSNYPTCFLWHLVKGGGDSQAHPWHSIRLDTTDPTLCDFRSWITNRAMVRLDRNCFHEPFETLCVAFAAPTLDTEIDNRVSLIFRAFHICILIYTYHIACTDTGLNMWVFSYTATLKPLYQKKDVHVELILTGICF